MFLETLKAFTYKGYRTYLMTITLLLKDSFFVIQRQSLCY